VVRRSEAVTSQQVGQHGQSRGRLRVPMVHPYLLCGAGGFALGVGTGLFGRGAIAATTVALERSGQECACDA
jgi:demethoxyubiquinone hydroxylase (CLK1/Coq7/Cat5 family)